jgi:formylmethanofuran dehydrogenase subunit E
MTVIDNLQKALRLQSKLIKEIRDLLKELEDHYTKCACDDSRAEEVKQEVEDQIKTDWVNENAPDETTEDKAVADAFQVESPKDTEVQEGEVDLKAVEEDLAQQSPTSL